MERLTKETIGCFKYTLKDHKVKVGDFGEYNAFFDYSMAVKRLGEYEDTGLTPEQIETLTADKDEQAERIMQMEDGLKKLRTSFQWLYETIGSFFAYKEWAKEKIDAIDALLGGKEE